MQSRYRLPLLLALAFIALAGAALAQNRVRAGDITIAPEPEWTTRTSGLPGGAVLAVLSPDDLGGFTPNLNVVIQPVGEGVTVSEMLEQSRAQIEGAGGKVESAVPITIDGRPAGRMVWTTKMQGRELKFHSTFILSGGKAYLLTGTSLLDSYRRYEQPFTTMAGSVRFLDDKK